MLGSYVFRPDLHLGIYCIHVHDIKRTQLIHQWKLFEATVLLSSFPVENSSVEIIHIWYREAKKQTLGMQS